MRKSNKKSPPSKKAAKLSQLNRINLALVDLADDLLPEDKKEAPASEPTVIKYLKGNGEDLGTALNLLRFFRKRISDRDKEIAGVT